MSQHDVVKSLTVLLVLAGGARGSAQPVSPDEAAAEPPVPRYRVEFILFAHTSADPTEEVFPDAYATADPRGAPPPLRALPFGPRRDDAFAPETREPARFGAPVPGFEPAPGGETLAGAEPNSGSELAPGAEPTPEALEYIDPFGRLTAPDDPRMPFRFRVLRADELELKDAYARLERLGAYRPLAHGGWIQDGLDESLARPMNLANLGIVNPRGTLRLTLTRFLHLSVDLQFQAPAYGASTTDPFALAQLAVSPHVRLVEQRRVTRSGELHYVDHPLFGLLFKISPAPEEEEVEDDTADLLPAA